MMLPETNIGSRPPGPAFGLLVGVLAVVAATAVRLALDPVVVGVPFIPYVLAVVVAGWIGGRPAGLLALGGSVLAADYFFLEPRYSFAIASTQGRVSAVVFIVITSCLLAVVVAWRRNRALLLRSQTVFAQAGQMGRLGAWAVDVSKPETLESNALYWSDETYRIFGYQPRAVRVSNALFFSRVHPEDRERVNQAMAQALATRKPYEIEHRMVHPDGSERTVHEHAEIEFDRTGRPRWIIGAVQDITEQRRTEQTLREASDRLRRILEHIHDALIIDDIDGRLVFANDRFLAMFGFDRSEVGSLRLEDYVAPEHRELLRDRHGRRVRGEEGPTRFEDIGLHRDGRRMSVEVDIVPVLDDGGMVIGTQSALRDVTDRKLAEDALRASEETARWRAEELEKLMDVVPTAIWVAHDPECRTITGNRAARHFYDARGGRNVSAGPVGGDQDGTHRFFRDGAELTSDTFPMREAAAKGIEIRDAELQVLLPSGRTITILGNATPLFDADQRTRGCIGAFMDITERKRLEQELRQNAEQLAEANRLKDEFDRHGVPRAADPAERDARLGGASAGAAPGRRRGSARAAGHLEQRASPGAAHRGPPRHVANRCRQAAVRPAADRSHASRGRGHRSGPAERGRKRRGRSATRGDGRGQFGMTLLGFCIYLRSHAGRIAALALIAVTTFKCFLYDLGSLEGLYRVASFVGLASALALVSLALQKWVLVRPEAQK